MNFGTPNFKCPRTPIEPNSTAIEIASSEHKRSGRSTDGLAECRASELDGWSSILRKLDLERGLSDINSEKQGEAAAHENACGSLDGPGSHSIYSHLSHSLAWKVSIIQTHNLAQLTWIHRALGSGNFEEKRQKILRFFFEN